MIKAFFVDFYGTVVHEDGEIIKKIVQIIFDTGNVENKGEIDSFWWNDFQSMFLGSYGERFETQRALEKRSLEHTLEKFGSSADADMLSNMMFEQWIKPPIFEESRAFFENSPLPVYIVSNIDTSDILKAIEYHSLKPSGVFTSEDARAYKPRCEIFNLALKETGLKPDEVIHIGDSLSSDVKGASAVNIRALWLNRFGKAVPDGVDSITILTEAFDRVKDITSNKPDREKG
ncbi:MAG: HAD family hydrolase [Clostridiales bacterium]|nr:HAD family hydrolase [Clostridiales bacterium]